MKQLAWFLFCLAWVLGGCGSTNDATRPVSGSQASAFDRLEGQRRQVLDQYYTPTLVEQMLSDARPLEASAVGFRPFSTAQYGQSLVEGEVARLYDVFDVRIPTNLAAFHQWAFDNGLVETNPANLTYWDFSRAGTRFMRDFGFDAIVYRPDEYHPVFTRTTDTWMFIREDTITPMAGDAVPPRYLSGRVQARHVTIKGGMSLQPIGSPVLWPWYVPAQGASYTAYAGVNETPVSGSALPEQVNPYQPQPPTGSQLASRTLHHFAASPTLSNKVGLKVGAWTNRAPQYVAEGLSFQHGSFRADRFTFGTSGLYVVPFDEQFWR